MGIVYGIHGACGKLELNAGSKMVPWAYRGCKHYQTLLALDTPLTCRH